MTKIDGIFKFVRENQIGVNKIKTKRMGFGDAKPFEVYFNGCQIDHVVKYKYLRNIVKSTRRVKEDAFGENYKYLCYQAHNALFWCVQKLKKWKNPPGIMFDAIMIPILVYGSGARGTNKAAHLAVDKVFVHYARYILCVKSAYK